MQSDERERAASRMQVVENNYECTDWDIELHAE